MCIDSIEVQQREVILHAKISVQIMSVLLLVVFKEEGKKIFH